MNVTDGFILAGLGLGVGTLGGMLGVGGSTLLLPALAIVFGPNQHVYQAAAMLVNLAIAVPATLRHRGAGAIMPRVVRWMLPASVLGILVGVAASNAPLFRGTDGGIWLQRGLGVFLLYVVWVNACRLRREWRPAEPPADPGTRAAGVNTARAMESGSGVGSGGVGLGMGLLAGLLGIGGGALAVPLQQSLLRIDLRRAIANSAAVMCGSAAVGAIYKNATLPRHGSPEAPLFWWSALTLAAIIAPLAFIGGRMGAGLTHRLPLRWVRAVFAVMLLGAAIKLIHG